MYIYIYEYMNKRILFPPYRKFVVVGRIKDSFKIYFHEIEKLLPMRQLFEKLKQHGSTT